MPITRDWAGTGGLQLYHRQIIEEGGGSGQPIAKRKSFIREKVMLGAFSQSCGEYWKASQTPGTKLAEGRAGAEGAVTKGRGRTGCQAEENCRQSKRIFRDYLSDDFISWMEMRK